jgi:hypothetical protein
MERTPFPFHNGERIVPFLFFLTIIIILTLGL